MPHQCTSCGREFGDGATEMLSGCPTCDGNRFQFIPASTNEQSSTQSTGQQMIEAEPDPSYDPADSIWPQGEDRAQRDARADMVDPEQLPATDQPPDDEPSEQPDLSDLREELEDRFGSIKIVDRGEYELNLMELYERRACIIELQENGRYAIQVPETMGEGGPFKSDVPNR